MKITERSYGGSLFIPRPIIHEDQNRNLIICINAWGNVEGSKKALSKITEFLEIASQDEDVTSPFDRIESLSKQANNLRIAFLIANDFLFRDFNAEEYLSGFEAFCLQNQGSEVTLLSIGSYVPYIIKKNTPPIPLMHQVSLSQDFETNKALPPIPGQMAGTSNSLNLNIQSFRKQPESDLLIINRTDVPQNMYLNWSENQSLDQICLSLAQSDENKPFWISKINLE